LRRGAQMVLQSGQRPLSSKAPRRT